jgi:hypothetical protein
MTGRLSEEFKTIRGDQRKHISSSNANENSADYRGRGHFEAKRTPSNLHSWHIYGMAETKGLPLENS